MPIFFRYIPEKSLVIFTHEGHVTDEEFSAAYQTFFKDPRFDQFSNYLVDLRRVDSTSRSPEALFELARFILKNFGNNSIKLNIAVVAPKNISFNLARMYEVFSSSVPWHFKVFQEMSAALSWLDIPENTVDGIEPGR